MNETTSLPERAAVQLRGMGTLRGVRGEHPRYEPPRLEIICLACEISSYAPDEGDTPLF